MAKSKDSGKSPNEILTEDNKYFEGDVVRETRGGMTKQEYRDSLMIHLRDLGDLPTLKDLTPAQKFADGLYKSVSQQVAAFDALDPTLALGNAVRKLTPVLSELHHANATSRQTTERVLEKAHLEKDVSRAVKNAIGVAEIYNQQEAMKEVLDTLSAYSDIPLSGARVAVSAPQTGNLGSGRA